MGVFITNTKGAYGSLALVKEQRTVNILKRYGAEPISFFYYNADSEANEPFSSRLDGIIGGLSFGDDLIMQLPTMMGFRFDNTFIDKFEAFRQNSSSRLIFYVHDDLLSDSSFKAGSQWIKLLNRGDALIVNNPNTAQYLANLGVKRHHYSFFKVNDFLSDTIEQAKSVFSQNINLINASQDQVTTFTNVGLTVYALSENVQNLTKVHQLSIQMSDPLMPYQLAQNGGWLIVWSESTNLSTSYEFALALSAGLPVVAQKGTIEAEWVKNYSLGIITSTTKQAAQQIIHIPKEQYLTFQKNVRQLGRLSNEGLFTAHAVASALRQA